MTAKLSKSDKCWLCLEDQAVKSPIHIFSECPALAGFRQVLFNDTYPSQHTGQQSLCQVTELALHGSVQELIERTDQNSYVHSMEQTLSKTVIFGGHGFWAENNYNFLKLQTFTNI